MLAMVTVVLAMMLVVMPVVVVMMVMIATALVFLGTVKVDVDLAIFGQQGQHSRQFVGLKKKKRQHR